MGQKRIFVWLTIFLLQILPQRGNMLIEQRRTQSQVCSRGALCVIKLLFVTLNHVLLSLDFNLCPVRRGTRELAPQDCGGIL